MIERELADRILTLRLAHGKANILDLELCDALRAALEEGAASTEVDGLVLTGHGTIFSGGVDLKKLLDGGPDYIGRFLESLESMLRALFLFPKPAVAAVNGHAIAGGAVLAFACDSRLMSIGRIGVVELLVGVPFPPMALEIVRFAVPQKHLRSMIYYGRTIDVDAAHAIGIIDDVVLPEGVVIRAHETAKHLAGIPPEAFRMTKRQLREPYLRSAAASDSMDAINGIWKSESTIERIRAYIAKTLGK